MKEWSDEELDKLFRQSADEFEPKYQPDDWQDLRRRLDETDGLTTSGWLKSTAPWLAAALLLLLGGIGLYYHDSQENQITNQHGSWKESVAQSSATPQLNESNKVIIPKGTTGLSTKTTPPFVELGTEGRGTTTENSKGRSSNSIIKGEAAPILAEKPFSTKAVKGLPQNPASASGVRKRTNPSRERGDGAILLSQKVAAEKRPANASDEKKRIASGGLVKLPNRPTSPTAIALSYPTVDYPNVAPIDIERPAEPELSIPKWSIRIGFAPDLSMVNMSEMKQSMKIGPSASLLVDYNISDRWALQTGVIRSLKNYKAMGGEYEWPESWKQKQMPEPNSVDGSCQVFEIPLNLRFDISQMSRGRWFAGAGLSSYKMQKEDYVYNYENYDPNNMDPWETKSGWAFLSHANVSLGYEHRINKRLSILAEPYAKIPLRGVGHGKVNLFTTGIWFSARYTPIFRK